MNQAHVATADAPSGLPSLSTTPRRHWIWLGFLILLITFLNAAKPLHIDDAAFYFNAAQVAHHPLDPYGFTVFWAQWPEPGNGSLTPPVLPYWWAIAIRLFGNSPVMWKLWLMPLIGLFIISLHRLFRRFAPGMEMPLVFLTALSPAFLPATNLMLDIPAMGLGLTALCIAMRAIDNRSYSLALLSGVTAAVAMQTKYTAAMFPAVIFVYGALQRRWWLSILPGLVAGTLFVLWEVLMARLYGSSHFMFHFRLNDSMKGVQPKDILWTAIPLLIGGLSPMVALLGLAALNFPRAGLFIGAAAITAAYAVVWQAPVAVFSFLVVGVAILAVIAMVVYALPLREHRDDLFVVLWLAMEFVGFEAISPFAASRRVMGLTLAMILVVGRLASRQQLPQRRPQAVWWIIGGSVAMGFGYWRWI